MTAADLAATPSATSGWSSITARTSVTVAAVLVRKGERITTTPPPNHRPQSTAGRSSGLSWAIRAAGSGPGPSGIADGCAPRSASSPVRSAVTTEAGQNPIGAATELEQVRQLGEPRGVPGHLRQQQIIPVDVQIKIANHRHDSRRHRQIVDRRTQLRPDGAADLGARVTRRQNALQVAVRVQQAGSGLVADSRDTR